MCRLIDHFHPTPPPPFLPLPWNHAVFEGRDYLTVPCALPSALKGVSRSARSVIIADWMDFVGVGDPSVPSRDPPWKEADGN